MYHRVRPIGSGAGPRSVMSGAERGSIPAPPHPFATPRDLLVQRPKRSCQLGHLMIGIEAAGLG